MGFLIFTGTLTLEYFVGNVPGLVVSGADINLVLPARLCGIHTVGEELFCYSAKRSSLRLYGLAKVIEIKLKIKKHVAKKNTAFDPGDIHQSVKNTENCKFSFTLSPLPKSKYYYNFLINIVIM